MPSNIKTKLRRTPGEILQVTREEKMEAASVLAASDFATSDLATSDLATSDLAQTLASLSVHDTPWHLNIDIVSSIASALTKVEPRPVSTRSAAAFDPDSFAAEHRSRACAGAREIAAMLHVCRAWRSAMCATDDVWLPLLHAAYPLLTDLPCYPTSRKPGVLFRRLYEAMQQVDQFRADAIPRQMSVLPRSPGTSLADFIFNLRRLPRLGLERGRRV